MLICHMIDQERIDEMKVGLQTWGSEGDIRPFTALAAGLVDAGHEVTLAVTDNIGRDYSEVAKKYGFKLIAVPNPEAHDPAEVEAVWREIISARQPHQAGEDGHGVWLRPRDGVDVCGGS